MAQGEGIVISEGTDGPGRPSAPTLPTDPRLPDEPTAFEVARTQHWLAKRGILVSVPTKLLALRIGVRQSGGKGKGGLVVRFAFLVLGVLGALAYQSLQYLPHVRGVEMTESKIVYFLLISVQFSSWFVIRRRERLAGWARQALTSPRRKPLDGWYVTSAIITFLGGGALGIAMYLTTPARTYAWSWLGLLALGAVTFTVILSSVLRSPVLAEDTASAAVDEALRFEDTYLVMPAFFAAPVVLDLATTNRQPHEFTWWLVAYVALAVGTQLIGWVLHRRRYRTLPPGYYGAPAVPVATSPPFDWAPKRA